MLKRRIIPIELLHNGRLVKSVRFATFRDVGDPIKSSQVYASQDADELIVLNVDRKKRDVSETRYYLQKIVETCFVPIGVGGGVHSIDDASSLIDAGADKVVINTAAYVDHALLGAIARRYGSQAVVVSIDVMKEVGGYRLFADCGRHAQNIGLDKHLAAVVDAGVGEIFINSIDRDGTMEGYDLDLLAYVRARCPVPLIVCGGAGKYTDLLDAFERGADAVACGSLFNFGDNNPLRVKAFLKNRDVPLKRI